MKRFLIFIVLASAMFSVGAMAQSAKFAASWDTDSVTVEAYATDEACRPRRVRRSPRLGSLRL